MNAKSAVPKLADVILGDEKEVAVVLACARSMIALESGQYIRWYGDNLWLFVPMQQKVAGFLATIPQYPSRKDRA